MGTKKTQATTIGEVVETFGALVEARGELAQLQKSVSDRNQVLIVQADSIRDARKRLERAQREAENGIISPDQLEAVENETAPLIDLDLTAEREARDTEQSKVEGLSATVAELTQSVFEKWIFHRVGSNARAADLLRRVQNDLAEVEAIRKAFTAPALSEIKSLFFETEGAADVNYQGTETYRRIYREACEAYGHEPTRNGGYTGTRELPAEWAFGNKRPLSVEEENASQPRKAA